jgi:hypothetical protein
MPPKKTTKKTTRKTTRSAKRAAPAARRPATKKTKTKKTGKARAAAVRAPSGLTEKTRISRHRNVASRTIDGQEVVIVPSSRKLQMLNEVATRIWALCDGRSIGDIVETITNEYAVSRRTARRDVMEFVGEIHKRGMVEIL